MGQCFGQFIDYCSKAFIGQKKIFSIATLKEYKKEIEPNYIIVVSMIVSYIALLYKFGIQAEFTANIELIKYMLLIPMLFCAFQVDLKEQIIPNRLNLLMFEIGLILAFIGGIYNINIAINMLLGMLVGGGIFLCTPNNVNVQGKITEETSGKDIHNNNDINIEW